MRVLEFIRYLEVKINMLNIKLLPLLLLPIIALSGCRDMQNDKDADNSFLSEYPAYCDKPVIYIYPEEKLDVEVSLEFNGDLTFTYPEYDSLWKVTAYPDGTLIDSSNREYNYLFWEGKLDNTFNINDGFCIEGEDTVSFLEEKLSQLGLTDKEADDFITYWAPRMVENNYNIISFLTEEELGNIELEVSPGPESIIRVYMVWKPSDIYRDIPEQKLEETPERTGYTVVEWGGIEK